MRTTGLRRTILLSICAAIFACHADARTGGVGFSSGGGGGGRSYSAPSHGGGGGLGYGFGYSEPARVTNPGYRERNWGNNYGGEYGGYGGYGYGGYGNAYTYGGYGGYGVNNGNYYPNGYGQQTLPPPFATPDPLADFYKQQQLNSQMAQQGSSQGTTSVSSMVLPNQQTQTQLPTDFGASQGRSVSRDAVVSVDDGNLVRENFHGSGLFTSVWWKKYKNAWYNPAWSNDWAYDCVDWDTLVAFWRGTAPASPADYEFGSNITFKSNKVYYGDKPMMTSEEYYHQAQLLADKGITAASASAPHKVPQVKDWAQLGVFSLLPQGKKFSTDLFQIAVNRDGKIGGNYYNVTNNVLAKIEGAIDKSNSRVCFTVGNNHSVVYDTGLGNLLSAQSPILVHLDKERIQQRAFVRLNRSKL